MPANANGLCPPCKQIFIGINIKHVLDIQRSILARMCPDLVRAHHKCLDWNNQWTDCWVDHFQSYTNGRELSTWNKTGNVLAQNGLTEDSACQVTHQLVSFVLVVEEAAFTSPSTHSSSIYQLGSILTLMKHMTNAWTHLIIHAYYLKSSSKWVFSDDWSSNAWPPPHGILVPKDNETYTRHINLLGIKDLELPFKIFLIVPFGLFHISLRPNSATRASSDIRN